jgi:hypothetical protein
MTLKELREEIAVAVWRVVNEGLMNSDKAEEVLDTLDSLIESNEALQEALDNTMFHYYGD